MPQHGFLRANKWKLGQSNENNDFITCQFNLTLTDDMRDRGGKWAPGKDYDCSVVLQVKVEPTCLTLILEAKNIGKEPIKNCQALFHTYYQIENAKAMDKNICYVEGLKGYDVIDKSPGTNEPSSFVEQGDSVFVYKEFDRIFSNTYKADLDVKISTGSSSKVHLQARGSINGDKIPTSVVVWNPHIDKVRFCSFLVPFFI